MHANALIEYIKNINCNRGYDPKVIGGIVVKSGTQFFLFTGNDYHGYDISHEDWINFNELIRKIDDEIDLEKQLKEYENSHK